MWGCICKHRHSVDPDLNMNKMNYLSLIAAVWHSQSQSSIAAPVFKWIFKKGLNICELLLSLYPSHTLVWNTNGVSTVTVFCIKSSSYLESSGFWWAVKFYCSSGGKKNVLEKIQMISFLFCYHYIVWTFLFSQN